MARAASQTKILHRESLSSPNRDDFAAMLEQSFQTQSPQEGAVIKGKVIAIENDFAMVDHADAVGHFLGFFDVMRRQDHGDAGFAQSAHDLSLIGIQ